MTAKAKNIHIKNGFVLHSAFLSIQSALQLTECFAFILEGQV